MATGKLQNQLQLVVQSIQWTYSVRWSFCNHQRLLVWRDGYYNGAIKTRKTVQPLEVSTEEASLQRSQQLRELYDSLSAGSEFYGSARRPCASLSPEDLNESEWFYLMCLSFSFPPTVGLPGKAFAEQRHVWLERANEADSNLFPRAILAKSAGMQTVVCIPFRDCVLEIGHTEKIEEDLGLIQHARSIFINGYEQLQDQNLQQYSKPVLSDNSTSNAASSLMFNSPPLAMMQHHQPVGIGHQDVDINTDTTSNDESEEESEEESEAEGGSGDSNMVITNKQQQQAGTDQNVAIAEVENRMYLQMSEDFFQLSTPGNFSNIKTFNVQSDDDCSSHYSQTISTILQNNLMMQMQWLSDNVNLPISQNSVFSDWRINIRDGLHGTETLAGSQLVLKYMLLTVPLLHTKPKDNNKGQTILKTTVQDDLGANHVMAERQRREKMNERFIILRSLVPFVTKMDKVSILGDTIEYVKLLRRQVHEFECQQSAMEVEQISKEPETLQSQMYIESSQANTIQRSLERSRLRAERESGTILQVSIIEADALLELQCPNREGLLLKIMQKLHQLLLEITSVQFSSTNDVFIADIRAKVKENLHGKRASIVEVKKAIHKVLSSY
ncbi:hypothetical protein ZOSMA_8G01330 [Zostera marina]|uniref:BHLH domain-containing protein n=1 Tax=Zostera marina TaxID=29655 RepID=A0A0K9NJN8_ZOSMR|nr:hypothetical protein ZOSMA_8G01330 [Zostera marina]